MSETFEHWKMRVCFEGAHAERQNERAGWPAVCVCGHTRPSHYVADGYGGEVTETTPRGRCAHLSCGCREYAGVHTQLAYYFLTPTPTPTTGDSSDAAK